MDFLKKFLILASTAVIVAMANEENILEEILNPIKGSSFTIMSNDTANRYGYLRRYGIYNDLDLLEFSKVRPADRFRFVYYGALQEISSGKCVNLISAGNHQLVLKSGCKGLVDGIPVPRWYYDSQNGYLIHYQTRNCLSPWNYLDPLPTTVKWVPGLDTCRDYNRVILRR